MSQTMTVGAIAAPPAAKPAESGSGGMVLAIGGIVLVLVGTLVVVRRRQSAQASA